MVKPVRVTWLLTVAAFLTFFDRAQLPPLLTVIARDMGVPVDEIGHSFTAYVIAYATGQLLWSAVSSRMGRVRLLTISIGIGALGNVIAALAPDPTWLSVGRLVAGAAFGATVPTVLTYFGDTLELRPRAAAAANLAAALSLGMTVGTLVASFAGEWMHWRLVFVIAAVSSALLVVFLAMVKEAPIGVPQRMIPALRRVLTNPWALFVLALGAVEGVILVGVISYLPVALVSTGESVAVAGLVVALFGIAVIALTPLVKLMVRRLPPGPILLTGGTAAIVAFSMLAVSINLVTGIVSTVLLGFSWASAHTQVQTWMTDAVFDARPVGMSLFAVAFFGGGAAGAAIGNLALADEAFGALFVLAAALAAVFTLASTVGRALYRAREA